MSSLNIRAKFFKKFPFNFDGTLIADTDMRTFGEQMQPTIPIELLRREPPSLENTNYVLSNNKFMEALALLDIVAGGENSRVQLKETVNNPLSVAQEIVAFSNSKGGQLIIGVNDKTGEITGLSFADLQRINNLLTNAANDLVKSPIVIETETVDVNGKKVIVVYIPEGIQKPHTDKDELIFIKNGSDKRKVTSREEISRMLQSSGNLYAEETILQHSSFSDFDWDKFRDFFEKKYKQTPALEELERLIHNFRLGDDAHLNVAGSLLFGKNLQRLLPQFFVNAVWFAGNEITDVVYRSSEDIRGTIAEQFNVIIHRPVV